MSGPARVVVVGPLPPPTNGMTRMTDVVLRSPLRTEFRLDHVDTSDHREIGAVGRLDVRNVLFALLHGLRFWRALLGRPALCYVPISRDRLGFLRDALMLLPARVLRRRTAVHFHSRDFVRFYDSEPAPARLLVRLCLGPRVHAIVLGENRRGDFGALIPPDRVHVVPNGIPDLGAGPDAGARERVVLHLSTLWREKGVFDVLETARRLAAGDPAARFVLAGSWYREDERDEAAATIARDGLERAVTIVDGVEGESKAELFRRGAVFVFPSRYAYEGHPLVVLEALAAGTPVVATRLGAIPEAIEDGREGFLVDEGDADALEDRVRRLLDDPALRSRMGAAARRRYEREFTETRFAERLGAAWRAASGATARTAATSLREEPA